VAEDVKSKALMVERQREDAEADAAELAENEELANNSPEYREYVEKYVYPNSRKRGPTGA